MKKLLRSACLFLMAALALQASAEFAMKPTTETRDVAVAYKSQPTRGHKVKHYADEMTLNGVTYGIDKENNMAVVLGAEASVTDVIMEDEVTFDGIVYDVKDIADTAFIFHPMTSVRMSEKLVRIGKFGFYECPNLTNVTIPNSVERIDTSAFLHCINLANVKIGENVKEIMVSAFYQDSALTSIDIPAAVKYLGKACFSCDANLKHINFLGDRIDEIDYQCFGWCGLEELILPEYVGAIGECMCWWNKSLTHVELPKNLDTTPIQAFVACEGLKSVVLPPNYTKIGRDCFFGAGLESINLENIVYYDRCALYSTPLAIDVVMNDNCTFVGESAFANTAIKSVKTGSATETIGIQSFYECFKLTSVELNEGLQSIGQQAFCRDERIPQITIPSTVTFCDGMAFWATAGLKVLKALPVTPPDRLNEYDLVEDYSLATLYVPDESIEAYQAAPYWQKFERILPISEAPDLATVTVDGVDYVLNLTEGTAILTDGTAVTGDFVVPNIITKQGVDCTVIGIGNKAFNENTNIGSITLNEDMETIGEGAFLRSSITALHIGAKVQSVGYQFNCRTANFAEITVDETNPYLCLENGLLMTKDKKQVLCLPAAYPATELILPEEVEVVKGDACNRCKNLKTIIINEGCKTIEIQAFDNCTEVTELRLSSTIEFIGNQAFRNFNKMTSLVLPENLKEIDYHGFGWWQSVKEITFNDKLEKIGGNAFNHNDLLEIVDLPASLTYIDANAFTNSNAITEFRCRATVPPEVVSDLWENQANYTTIPLKVPEGCEEAYANAPVWQKFETIMPLTNNVTVNLDGAIYELDLIHGTAILTDGKATTGDFVVPNTVSTDRATVCTVIGIGDGAFDENTNLTSITLNEDLETIGDDAFQYSSIPALHLPAKVQSVGHDFHYKATSLAEITVDENNPYLCAENSLLMSKDKKIVWGFPVANPATELVLPDEVEIVKNDAVNRCKNLKKIVINDGCKTIENYAFDNCTACASLTMGKNITYVGYMAFRSFKALTELTLPEELLEVDGYGFSFNTNVKSLVVPNKVERIGQGAFNHFDACERFELPASLTNYGPTPFSNCNSLQEMINHAVEPPVLNDELFNNESLYSTVTLYVPAGSKEAYYNANIWQKFVNVEEMPVSSVDGVRNVDKATVVGVYTLDGKRMNQMQPGVNIVRMSDGTSRKVIK